MGQRLNLEIWNNGKVLANAYYHWSAYTDSAASVVNEALKYIKDNSFEEKDSLLYAIRALEATGAGLTDREIDFAKKVDCLKGVEFSECNGRNEGLIGISENEIQSTRTWQEFAAYIFIDEKRISFRVIEEKRKWEYEKEQEEEYGNVKAADGLKCVNWNNDDIKFDNWDEFFEFLKNQDHEAWISNIDPYNVIEFIY